MTREQKFGLYALIAVIVAFLIGSGWQYSRARDFEQRLDQTTTELTFERLESKLAAAIIEADRGNYEIARQLASDFFTDLQREMPRASEESKAALVAISGHRDAIITAASRSDPQTGSLLAQLYSTYRVAFGDAPVTPRRGAVSTPPVTSTTNQ